MDKSLLVAVDGSNHSFEAVKEAVKLAETFDLKIFIVNVQPSFHTLHTRFFIKESDIKEYQQELFLNAANSAVEYVQALNLNYEVILRVGNPTQQICKLAKELQVRYILIGSRGMGAVKGTVLGSVSHGVVHQSTIPIMIIPQKYYHIKR